MNGSGVRRNLDSVSRPRKRRRPQVKAGRIGLTLAAALAVAAVAVIGAYAVAQPPLSRGPHGEKSADWHSVKLTKAQIARIKAKHATAAIVFHYKGNDWSRAQEDGLKSEFKKLGIKVIAVTDANFDAHKQASDIQTVLVKHPSIIVSIPVDPVSDAPAYQAAEKQGVKLVFMDNVPAGMRAGKDYVSVVSADNYGNGVASATLMCQALHGKGTIATIFHAADFFVTKQRYQGFKDTITKRCKGVEIVAEKGIPGSDFSGQAQTAASAILTQHPDLDGIWAVWDVPAEGVLAALRAAGNTHTIITTEDLGKNVAISMASKGSVYGLGAQRPFDQGVTEARLAGYSLIGKKAPAYVALSALPVTHANVLQAWQQVYHAPAPSDISKAYQK
jgi:ribose transport system substrate-binding protein